MFRSSHKTEGSYGHSYLPLSATGQAPSLTATPLSSPSSGINKNTPGASASGASGISSSQYQKQAAAWSAVGEIGAGLANMAGMIASTAIQAKSNKELIAAQTRATNKTAKSQALLAEKQSVLAQAQAALLASQPNYIIPLAIVGVAAVVGFVIIKVVDTKQGK